MGLCVEGEQQHGVYVGREQQGGWKSRPTGLGWSMGENI